MQYGPYLFLFIIPQVIRGIAQLQALLGRI